MKKILLASTMLAGSAGFAAAEVAVTGYAEMGIWSDALGDVQFWQEIDVTFAMTGTTDGGLEFGASVDLDEAPINDMTDDDGTTVWISGAFGKLTMGDTDGGLDWAVAEMDGGLTSLADDHTTYAGFFNATGYDGAGDGQIVRYENTFGDVSFAVSAEQGDNGIGVADDILGLGVKYNADLGGTTLALGLGYQAAGDAKLVGVSVGATLAGGFTGKIGYMTGDVLGTADEGDALGVELTYASGPVAVSVNYGDFDSTNNANDSDGWGLAANYDLGGGAKVMFGYGTGSVGGAADVDTWSLGLGMSF